MLCRYCLVMWLSSEHQASCPLCRCAIVDLSNHNNTDCEAIADRMPTDLSMAALVHSAQILSKDHVCCVHQDTEAVSICLSCYTMFCQSCAASHVTQSRARHHVLKDLSSLTAERLAASRPATCSKHTEEPSSMFCTAHGVVVCQHCISSKHRTCPRIIELEEKLQEFHGVLAWFSATLKAGETTLERAISQLDQELLEAEKRTEKTMKEIDEACDRLENSVKACRRYLKELQETKNSEAKEVINRKKAVLLEHRGKLKSHRRLVDRVDKTVSCNNVHDMETTLKSLVNKLDLSLLQRYLKDVSMTTIQIHPLAVSEVEKKLSALGQLNTQAISVNLQSGSQIRWASKPPSLRFHPNHGKNVILSNDCQTAEWVDRVNSIFGHHGIVVGRDPLFTDTLYEVEVGQPGYMLVGVTVDHPANLSLPDDALDWKHAVSIANPIVSDRGHVTKTTIGKPLKKLRIGSRVGVLVDAASSSFDEKLNRSKVSVLVCQAKRRGSGISV
nr:hypothetical protein BaRGS_020780 [Batillaria attramentaria]